MRRSIQGSVLFVSLLALTACGGGGGDSSSGGGSSAPTGPISVQFSPDPVKVTYAQGDITSPVSVSAKLSRLPSGTVYTQVLIDGHVLAGDQISIANNGNGSFTGTFTPLCTLAPGSYKGNITVKLSYDSQGLNQVPLSGNVLPYAFTVNPGMVVTTKLDGVLQSAIATKCTLPRFVSNSQPHLVELTSNVPVTWSYYTVGITGTAAAQNVVTTPTTWSATVYSPSTSTPIPGIAWGTVGIIVAPTSGGSGTEAYIDVWDQ